MAKNRVPVSDWRKQRLLEWLCTAKVDRMPPSQSELAEELSLPLGTMRQWKEEPEFLAAWEKLYRLTVGSPERAQRVMDELYETAIDRTDPRQVTAAGKYLEAIDAVKPRKVDVTVTGGKAAKDLSDDDLYALLAQRAAEELEARQDV